MKIIRCIDPAGSRELLTAGKMYEVLDQDDDRYMILCDDNEVGWFLKKRFENSVIQHQGFSKIQLLLMWAFLIIFLTCLLMSCQEEKEPQLNYVTIDDPIEDVEARPFWKEYNKKELNN